MADQRICAVEGCGKHSHRGGKHCSMHAERIRKHGDPHANPRKIRGICSLPECNNPHYGRGYCTKHYKKLVKFGDPLAGGTDWGAAKAFADGAVTYSGDDCLTFPFAKTEYGYGWIRDPDRKTPIGAHVYVAERAHGPRPSPKHEACHTCGNGHLACIAPKHLYWGTRADNVADAISHGTYNKPPTMRGEAHPMAKFTADEVRAAKAMMDSGMTQGAVAKITGIRQTKLSDIKNGKSWRHLFE